MTDSNPGKGFTNTKETTRKDISKILRQFMVSDRLIEKEIKQDNNKIIRFNEIYCPNETNEQYHSPSLISVKDNLLLVWFAGNYEGYFNHIKFSYYNMEIKKWTIGKIICEVHYHSIQNPVLYYDEDMKRLILFASIFPAKTGQFNSRIIYQIAHIGDNIDMEKIVWSRAMYIKDTLYGFLTKHKPYKVSNNVFALPVYHSNKNNMNDYSGILWCVLNLNNNMIDSIFKPIPNTEQMVQPCVVDIKDIQYTFYRTRRKEGKLSYMVSYDKLTKYSKSSMEMPIINNNSGFDILYINGKLLIVYNEGIKFTDRHRLSMAISSNLGKTIDKIINIEPSLTMSRYVDNIEMENSIWKKAEFSYPSMIKKEDIVYISYTYNRETIKTVSFNIKDMDN